MFILSPKYITKPTSELGVAPRYISFHKNSFLMANRNVQPTAGQLEEAAAYIREFSQIDLSATEVGEMLMLYPKSRIALATEGMACTSTEDELAFMVAHFFLECSWPTIGDEVDMQRFVDVLKDQASWHGYKLLKGDSKCKGECPVPNVEDKQDQTQPAAEPAKTEEKTSAAEADTYLNNVVKLYPVASVGAAFLFATVSTGVATVIADNRGYAQSYGLTCLLASVVGVLLFTLPGFKDIWAWFRRAKVSADGSDLGLSPERLHVVRQRLKRLCLGASALFLSWVGLLGAQAYTDIPKLTTNDWLFAGAAMLIVEGTRRMVKRFFR